MIYNYKPQILTTADDGRAIAWIDRCREARWLDVYRLDVQAPDLDDPHLVMQAIAKIKRGLAESGAHDWVINSIKFQRFDIPFVMAIRILHVNRALYVLDTYGSGVARIVTPHRSVVVDNNPRTQFDAFLRVGGGHDDREAAAIALWKQQKRKWFDARLAEMMQPEKDLHTISE